MKRHYTQYTYNMAGNEVMSSSGTRHVIRLLLMSLLMTTVCAETTVGSLDATTANEEFERKKLALEIAGPIFLFCFGGSAILYCVHKIRKNLRRPKMELKKTKKASQIMYPPAASYEKNRPNTPHSGRVQPYPVKGELPVYVPDNSHQRWAQNYVANGRPRQTFQRDVASPDVSPPPDYTVVDERELKRARLLENALREARERRQRSSSSIGQQSRPSTSQQLIEVNEENPAEYTSPNVAPVVDEKSSTPTSVPAESTAPTASLLPNKPASAKPDKTTSGMSIRTILKMKMLAKAYKNPPK